MAEATSRLDIFRRLAADNPTEPRARYGLANELHRSGKWDDAIVEFRAYLELSDDEGSAWGRLAECLAQTGRADEAADAYLSGIECAERHGHTGMAADFLDAIEAL